MLQLPPLYPITDASRGESLSAQVRRLGEAGFPLVQFRGKPLDSRAQWVELRAALAEAAANGGWPLLCVNDRADLALLAAREGLAPWGLHLGQEDLPAAEAARLPGLAACHFGASTHESAEWDAPPAGCDHAGVGPFRGTATKADHAEPIGLAGLRAGCAALRARGIAPIAIGGLTAADAPDCFAAGAEALAMVGEVHRAGDPAALGWALQQQRWRVRPLLRPGQGVVLLGGRGAGKTALGQELARRTGLPFHDLDAAFAAPQGPSASSAAEAGRARAARELAARLTAPAILALGRAWEDPACRAAVAASGSAALWLAESPHRAWERVAGAPGRPRAQERAAFMADWAARVPTWSLAPMAIPFGHTSRELASALLDW